MTTSRTIILASLLGATVSSCDQAKIDDVKKTASSWVEEARQYVIENTEENMEKVTESIELVQGQVNQQVENLSAKNAAMMSQLSSVFATDKTVILLSKAEDLKEELAADIEEVRSNLNKEELSNRQKQLLTDVTETYEQVNEAITEVKKASQSQLKAAKLHLQEALEETVRNLDDLEIVNDQDE